MSAKQTGRPDSSVQPAAKHNAAKPGADKTAASPGSADKNSQKQRQQQNFLRAAVICMAVIAVILFAVIVQRLGKEKQEKKSGPPAVETEGRIPRPELDVELLTVNEYSRPAYALTKVNGIVVHYTANPGTSAIANRNYFEGLKESHATKASSHFVVGLDGEVVQCIPSNEIAYASNERNDDTISIECCIGDDTGKFNQATYDSAVHLTAWLVEYFGLETEDVIRHYDVTGKACPKYFVDVPTAWEQFRMDVQAYLESYGAA